MRRPHVYERSAPRPGRDAYRQPLVETADAARDIAEALDVLIPRAESAGLSEVVESLVRARAAAGLSADRTR